MNKQTLKQLEKIAYNLERVLDGKDKSRTDQPAKTESYVRGSIANWYQACAVCKQTFLPTNPRNTRCLDCQLGDRYVGKERRA